MLDNDQAVTRPSCVRVGQHLYEVGYADWDQAGAENQVRLALLREILYLLCHEGRTISVLEQDVCRHLENGLLAVLRDNPEVVRYLTGDDGPDGR